MKYRATIFLFAFLLCMGACKHGHKHTHGAGHEHAHEPGQEHAHEPGQEHAHEPGQKHAHEPGQEHAHEAGQEHAHEAGQEHAHEADHEHAHEHEHEPDPKESLTQRHEHSSAHPAGHNHHEEGHGHGGAPMVSVTLWSDLFELFGEHPPGVVGQETPFLLHITELEGFVALERGTVTLEFGELRGTTSTVIRPGIFRIALTPKSPGTFQGRLRIAKTGSVEGVIEGLEFRVFTKAEEAANSTSDDDDDGVIEFLKEQQWGVPFGTAFAEMGSVVASVQVAGRIDTPPGGIAEIGAPVTGRLVAPSGGLPRPGMILEKGQVVASLMPAPSSPEAAARASLAVAEAGGRASAARMAVDRAERLIKDEAISQRELEDARREMRIAKESVRAARRAADLYSGARGADGREAWQLRTPIDGTLVSVHATVGATVSQGESLFRIVDTRELWVVARVPEQDAARLRTDRDPSFQIAGLDAWNPIHISGDNATGSLVTISRLVDPVSRTVDVIYATNATDTSMRVGGLVQVSLPAGEDFAGVVVPKSALIDQEGRSVVYVQVDGEHFEERLVRIGPRAGAFVAIRQGLRAGERIVTRGAHLIKLVNRASSAQPHGHIH